MSVIVAEVLVSLAGLAYAVDVTFIAWSVVWSVFLHHPRLFSQKDRGRGVGGDTL